MSERGHNQEMKQTEEHDPVCGMTVDPSEAASSIEHHGATVYFCSESCAAKFRAAPEKYVQAKPGAAPSHPAAKTEPQGEYTCPMHPEVKQTGPGSCPKCGMALESVAIPAPAKSTEYTCPMHPEIVRDAPGSCPICGMALEPRQMTAEDTNPELADMTKAAVDQRRSRRADARAYGLRISAFHADATPILGESVGMDRICSRNSGGTVVRAAVLRQGLAIGRASQPQYVHADCPWHWLGLSL
jgi:YHS domain-containing protein